MLRKQPDPLASGRRFSAAVLLPALVLGASAAAAQPAPKAQLRLPAVKLRGYGNISGWFENLPGNASRLSIACESAAKAQLLHAKYLSDLSALPGVGAERDGVRVVSGQGAIAAARQGKVLRVMTAPNAPAVRALVARTLKGEKPILKATVAVPMWLDRWDKWNFRHYYRPWETPPGNDPKYDFIQEFEFARANKAGFVFWNDLLLNDSAEGMMNYGWFDWAAREAARRSLPVGINTGGGDTTWMLNRFREQTQQKMPGFTGNFHSLKSPSLGGAGSLSWSATTGKDERLAVMQKSVGRFAAQPNVTTFLEPHGELHHGPQDIFLEYGPVADRAYRRFLQQKYGTPARLAARWGRDLKSWDEVRVPEVAAFAGLNAQSIVLGGTWRIGYEELLSAATSAYHYDRWSAPKSTPAPQTWFEPDFDDAGWPQVLAPGHDRALFGAKRPAVLRRRFSVPADWKARHPRVWLYLWDLDEATGQEVRAVLNGREVERAKVAHYHSRWSAVEVSQVLAAGNNTLALRLPQGVISYKVYLSPVEPKQYPDLGPGLNAQWVDFADFTQWTRTQAVLGGVEMIRRPAPGHQIVLMAPSVYADGVKKIASDYGGNFHDTGFMGGFWADYPSSVMRGADLPFSVEPGGPAKTLAEWKKQWGLWQTEGVQAVDYFIHIGNVLWNPEIKADFEKNRRQISLMGQSHYPKAQVAVLYSDRVAQLTGYPWGAAPNTNLGSGYWRWNAAAVLRGSFPYDGLTQSSFVRGEADPYRVIIDTNTSIMDESMVSDIEKWVRAGGTFVTLAQTGRHTPERPNAWPIARLTGYRVAKIDRLKDNGDIEERGTLAPAPGQKIFGGFWKGKQANGLHLEKTSTECQDLLLWNDGSIAAGMRPLGKGFVVQLGAKFTGTGIFDRVEPGGNTGEVQLLRALLSSVLDWRGVRREAARLSVENEQVLLRPAVTNNGLYDTWTLWNWSGEQRQNVSVVLDGRSPATAFEARDGKSFPVTKTPGGALLENIVLEPLETRVFLTPRGKLAQAPLQWFDLQRKWWRGTTAARKYLPPAVPRFARDLSAGWKFQTLDAKADAASLTMTAASFNDKTWATRDIGIWNAKAEGGRGIFRRFFTVPREWARGRASLWLSSWFSTSFVGNGRIWLDDQEVKGRNAEGYFGIGLPSLVPGSTHTIVVEAQSDGVLAGLRGQSWISFEPSPAHKIDLAGQWTPSADGLRDEAPIALPGPFNAQFLKRSVVIDARHRGQSVMITVEGTRELAHVLINGRLMRRHHHMIGERWSLNLTPFVRWGEANEIEIVRWEGAGAGTVREVSLGFFDPKFYP